MLPILSVAGFVVLTILIRLFFRMRSKDHIAEMMEKRRPSCRLVSRADYVEGMQTLPVAISVSDENLYYENPDLQASFELSRIDEIEYDDELATGHSVATGSRALRLRSHGAAFEFVMPIGEITKWETVLPARRTGGQPAVKVS